MLRKRPVSSSPSSLLSSSSTFPAGHTLPDQVTLLGLVTNVGLPLRLNTHAACVRYKCRLTCHNWVHHCTACRRVTATFRWVK
ncbi:hypothetical protein E2C01_059289 [Portunus trituberculatus]|uniref:Uncharacterized protein n=1 Tax=Portunus trituberculatus TaxID=210409 RepID=A0A5B7GYR3_PORTR|nr:hypothetical protein [Portunus trituberculatus]